MSVKFQRGVTIVELTIASALGVVLMAAVLRLYLSHSQSWRLQQDVAVMQQQARAGFAHLRDAVLGVMPQRINGPYGPFVLAAPLPGTGQVGVDHSQYDAVVMVAWEEQVDCVGASWSSAPPHWKRYEVVRNELRCRDSNRQTVALIDGVDLFQVRYGVDMNGDGLVNRYLPVAQARPFEEAVVALRVGLVLRSVGRHQVRPPAWANEWLFERQFGQWAPIWFESGGDGYYRQSFVATMALRQ